MGDIRFAVIGLGIGALHLDAIKQQKGAVATALCDLNEQALKEKAQEYDVAFTCTDYHELLTRDDVDAVCVTTPDHLHRDMVVELLAAGKHVLCEKPLALNSDDCKAMIEAAGKSEAYLMVGQVCRMTPAFAYAKQLIDEGVIGELFFVESEYAHDYSHMGKCWRNDPEINRHPFTGGGCHAVDLVRWIAGDPIEVYGITNKKVLTDWPCDDSAIAVLKLPNDVMGKVFVSTGCKRNYTMRSLFYGTKGTLVTDNTSSTVSIFKEEFEGKTSSWDRGMENIEMKLSIEINNHNIPAEIREFCDVINGKQELKLTGYEGAATVAVCEAVIESAATGMPQKVKYLHKS